MQEKKGVEQKDRVIKALKVRVHRLRNNDSTSSSAVEKDGVGVRFTLAHVMRMIREYVSLSHRTISDDHWHQMHPGSASTLFGFKTWNKAKAYISYLFPDVDVVQTSDFSND